MIGILRLRNSILVTQMESLYYLMREYLKKSAIKAQDVGNGRLFFSVNGLNFIYDANESDPHFYRMALPQINRQNVVIQNLEQQIHQLNQNYKVTKIVRNNDGTLWILADAFVYSTENIEQLFVRHIQALMDMINEYRNLENTGNGTIQAQ